MRPESIVWERAAEVRAAADGWRRAGAIDAATHDAIRRAYPDPCVTPSAIWRVLTAVMVTIVVLCAFGALAVTTRPREAGLTVLLWLFAAACAVATECMEASPRLARRGAAGAASSCGIVLFLAGLALFLSTVLAMSGDAGLDVLLLASALTWAIGAWRWGSAPFAGLSAASLFVLLARLPLGRVAWVIVGAALIGLATPRLDDGALAPSHRRAAMVVLLAGIAAVYVALNVYSLDQGALESLRQFTPQRPRSTAGFAGAAVATAVLPVVILVWAWQSRRTMLLDAGIVLLALSLATLRYYVHVAPLWAILGVSGTVVIAFALAAERTLRRAPGGERAGFTLDQLYSDERQRQLLQVVPVVGTLAPGPVAPASAETRVAPGGGAFGGGGASGQFRAGAGLTDESPP